MDAIYGTRFDHGPTAVPDIARQQVASFRGARHTVFVVSSLPADDVQAVARVMAGPVVRALEGT